MNDYEMVMETFKEDIAKMYHVDINRLEELFIDCKHIIYYLEEYKFTTEEITTYLSILQFYNDFIRTSKLLYAFKAKDGSIIITNLIDIAEAGPVISPSNEKDDYD